MNMVWPVVIFLAGGVVGFWIAVRMLQKADGIQEARKKLTQLEQEIRDYIAQVARLDSEKTALSEKLSEQHSSLEQAQEKLHLQFKNLAHEIFEEKNAQSKQNLQEILKPLKEDLSGFKKHISESFGAHANEQFALKREIENVVKVSKEMKFQTENLSKALKGDTKVQGNWGEVILERILEASGLRKGETYYTQGAGMGLKHPEHGGTQKPDVIIRLPENKHAIIDAKVSLTAYERFCAEENEAAKAEHLSQFLLSVKTHVKGLTERRYQDTPGLDTPDYVLMFMPIEGAYALAMQQDAELHGYAWDRKIIIVCPSTLFAILKIIDSMWKLERQNKNADKIAERGGLLYDKIVGFVEDLSQIGVVLGKAQSAYDNALNKLSGRGGVLRQVEQLRELGVKNTKQVNKKLLEETDGEAEEVSAMLAIEKEDAA